MGQRCSRYFGSIDGLHMESNTVRVSQMETEECDTTCDDNTFMKNDIASHKQDSLSNACSASMDTACNAISTSSCTSATVTAMSSQINAKHQPHFFTHMTEEHWERLNMMCIVSPSSS